MNNLSLLPYPRTLTPGEGSYLLQPNRRIVLEGAAPWELGAAGRRLQAALAEHAQVDWELAASPLGPPEEIGATLRIAPGDVTHEQGYTLAITPEGMVVEAPTATGVFYGICTLAQILQQQGRELPALRVTDWPDLAVRGLMLDISRDKVPRMETLFPLIDQLAGWKLNQIQLYTEHTFAYRQHPDVWATASPVTGDEILALDAFCQERHIELVPNQNSLGHMHRWLIHPRYAALAEIQGEFMTPLGPDHARPVEPVSPGSRQPGIDEQYLRRTAAPFLQHPVQCRL
jgi:N-acetyl-beta-hexosaminidase